MARDGGPIILPINSDVVRRERGSRLYFFENHHSEQKGNQGLFERKGRKAVKLDREEKEILEAYESGQLKLSKPSKKEIAAIKAAALNTFKKDKRITIRLYDQDFKGIQKKALQMGIPYQTLISGVIHRYIEGDLISKDG